MRKVADIVALDVAARFDSSLAVRHPERAAGRQTLPVVALTADAMTGERERLLALGFNGYLSKPIEPSALVRALAA